MQKEYKIAIVKFCLYICEIAIKDTRISNFSKFKVQSLDIATPLGAGGPQQGPKGPQGPPALQKELEGWARSNQIF